MSWVWWWDRPWPARADGLRYAHHAGVISPFHRRWLLPRLCGQSPRRWWVAQAVGYLVLFVAAFVFLARGVDGWRALAGAAMVAGLPGLAGSVGTRPVAVDVPAMGLALGSAAAFVWGWWPAGIVLVIVAGMVRETAPIFAALWAWNPLLLVGLVGVRWWGAGDRDPAQDRLGGHHRELCERPLIAGLWSHEGGVREAQALVLPWGGLLAAVVWPSWQLVVVAAVAYGQLLVATDWCRLFLAGAAPVMAATVVGHVPAGWLVPLVLVTWFNPFDGRKY